MYIIIILTHLYYMSVTSIPNKYTLYLPAAQLSLLHCFTTITATTGTTARSLC